jgi:hypothetical protein
MKINSMRISFLLLIFIIFMKTEIVAINPGSYGFFMRNSGQFDSRFGYCLKSKIQIPILIAQRYITNSNTITHILVLR